ncbi:hypothetical protein RPO42_03145, partial [Staphylococcus aureus]|nr:hypothetical protein [Staphylococcus aureus]
TTNEDDIPSFIRNREERRSRRKNGSKLRNDGSL